MQQSIHWLALSLVKGLGRRRLVGFMQSGQAPEQLWDLNPAQLARLPGSVGGVPLPAGGERQNLLEQAERLYVRLSAMGGRVIGFGEAAYPPLLAAIPDPPAHLFVRGASFPAAAAAVALVGTRHPTPYGKAVALRMARELAEAGVAVVSGFAQGIDGAAHQGALSGGGITWGVLGTGVDQIYPRAHTALAAAIMDQGALLSELLPGSGPLPHHFPERNRIISGLCQAVVVIEAGEKSGTLITVDHALAQGRDVFAVPGPVTSEQSVGPHRLIKQGATLVTSAADVLLALGATTQPAARPTPEGLSETGRLLLGWLGSQPWHVDDLARATGRAAGEILAEMLTLELSGLVRTLSGGYIVRI